MEMSTGVSFLRTAQSLLTGRTITSQHSMLGLHRPTSETPFARQRNAIQIAFRWWADDGSLLLVFGPLPYYLKKPCRS